MGRPPTGRSLPSPALPDLAVVPEAASPCQGAGRARGVTVCRAVPATASPGRARAWRRPSGAWPNSGSDPPSRPPAGRMVDTRSRFTGLNSLGIDLFVLAHHSRSGGHLSARFFGRRSPTAARNLPNSEVSAAGRWEHIECPAGGSGVDACVGIRLPCGHRLGAYACRVRAGVDTRCHPAFVLSEISGTCFT